MPYIIENKRGQKDRLNKLADELIEIVEERGEVDRFGGLTYFFCRLFWAMLVRPVGALRYAAFSSFFASMREAEAELRRRFTGDYEETKIEQNGDFADTVSFGEYNKKCERMKKSQKGETLTDIVTVGGMVMLLTFIPFYFIWHNNWWLGMMIAIMLVFAAVEIAVKVITGYTLSTHFWRWSARSVNGKYVNFWRAMAVIAALLGGWLLLLIHLGWKLMAGRKYEEDGPTRP